MNICFGVPGEGRETRFIAEADKAGIKQIKGHR
jgi:phosphoserine aminotransferase